MRNFHIITLLAVGLFVAFAMSTFQPAFRKGGKFRSSGFQQPVEEAVAIPGTGVPDTACHSLIKPSPALTPAFHYDDGRVRLTGEAGSMPFVKVLSVRELPTADLPPLEQGMVNVTRYAAGYRMQPDGMVFNRDISIVLPYDPALLPAGFTPEDIVTYYYDVQYGHWVAIARDSVSSATEEVYSRVNHFTDFINAVIKVPEMPETEAFTPTSIKELEAADPLEGLQLIQAPTANNSGTANLSYQLEIPAGRQGMQPNLALSYSSAGGNGWLGVGWDIPIPSITVDTRWGVPRYESGWESEIYVYGGEQLVTMDGSGHVRKMPHRTNLAGQTVRLPDGERFYARAGEAHDSIVRHGTTPQDYWWEVVDRYGVTSYYGAYPPGDTTQGPTHIGSSQGIARWALAATVDANGNMVKYYYSMDCHTGAGGEQGRQLYLDSINYTGHYTGGTVERGIYTVVFNRNGGRGDIITNGRNGFKEVTAATLCNVQVKFNSNTVRTFFFVTDTSRRSNYKTRLYHLIRVDDRHTLEDVLLQTHGATCIDTFMYYNIVGKIPVVHYDFEYYDYPAPEEMFTPEVEQDFSHTDGGISSSFQTAQYYGTALGATKGKSWGLGGTATVGYGPDVATTLASAGGNFDYSRSKNSGLLTLIDLDGDGLADKVYKRGGNVYYRPQVRLSDTTFDFGQEIYLEGIRDFLLEVGDNIDFGLQLSVVVVAASGGIPTSKATTTNYFSDINADGRPDLVTKEGVYFNCRHADGTIHFSPASDLGPQQDSSYAPNTAIFLSEDDCTPFLWDGEIDPGLECGDEITGWDTVIYDYRPGCTGSTRWGHRIREAGDTSFVISGCTYCHFGDEGVICRYCPETGWDTLDICSQQNEGGWIPWGTIFDSIPHDSTIQIGDCYYDYISSGTSKKVMERRPRNSWQCGSGNGRDPDIDAVRVWIAPMDGTVEVSSRIRLLPDSSESRLQSRYADGVAYRVQLSRHILWDIDFSQGVLTPHHVRLSSASDTIIISGDIGADDTATHTGSATVRVLKGDMLFFDLNSKDNHPFDKTDWRQVITYQDMEYGEDMYGLDNRHYDSESDFLLTGENHFAAPVSGQVSISGTILADHLTRPAQVRISRIQGGQTVSSRTIAIPSGTAFTCQMEGTDTILWNVDSGEVIRIEALPAQTGQYPNWAALTFNPVLRFSATLGGVQDTLTYHLPLTCGTDTLQLLALQPSWFVPGSQTSHSIYRIYSTLFGSLYRGWGRFGYNNNTFRMPDRAIRLDRIIPPEAVTNPTGNDPNSPFSFTDAGFDYDDIDTSRLSDGAYLSALFASHNLYDPLSDSTSWVQVTPYPEYGAYMSYGNLAFFSREVMANTRMADLNFTDEGEAGDDADIPDYESVIPVSTDGFPVRTIRKQNVSVAGTGSFGATVPCSDEAGISLSTSGTGGHNRITADCMDMNGDGFPDFVTDKKVQYTMPWGGIGSATHSLAEDEICRTNTSSLGSNFGASALIPKRGSGQNPSHEQVTHVGSGSVSANLGNGSDNTTVSYVDINGDGLPDRVTEDGSVRLNLGYGFSAPETWGNTFVRGGSSVAAGVNVGLGYPAPDEGGQNSRNFDFAQASISGGIGVTHSTNSTLQALADINGDGLPDQISIQEEGTTVRYNLGGGQWSAPEPTAADIGQGASFSEGLNASVTVGFTFLSVFKLNFGVQSTPFSRTFSRDHKQLADINGDGYADMVTSDSEDRMSVRYNRAGKTNLLRKVTNFCGSYTELDYALSAPCYRQPQRQWDLQRVSTGENTTGFPSSGITTLDSIAYRNPNYNRYERTAYGYDTVIVKQYNTMDSTSLYRFTVQGFNNSSFFKRGRKESESVHSADGRTWVEIIYHALLMDWENPTDTIGDSGSECHGLAYTDYEAEITRYYEGLPAPQIVTEITRRYDRNHNVLQYVSKGDTTRTDEYFSADISYLQGLGHNLISLPVGIEVRDKQNQLLQKRTAGYDTLGNLSHIELLNGNIASRYDYRHDIYGNVTFVQMPKNYRNQRMNFTYGYDTVAHAYPVSTRDAFRYTSSATYDYRFGKPLTTTDLNGNTMRYHYDEYGRLDTLVGPNEVAANKPYTIAMEYHPYLSSGNTPYAAAPASAAVTAHYDVQHPDDPIRTFLFRDGTGRLLQTKRDAEVDGVPQLVASGRTEYDCFGRQTGEYHPFAGSLDDTTYDSGYDAATLTSTTYDILDRVVKTVLPTHDSTSTAYGFGTHGGKTYFSTTTTDPNGIPTSVLTGSRRQQVKTIAPLGAVTTFTYSPIGQLLTSTDPCGHTTSYTYDKLGRMTSRTHPDAGTDSYYYDPAGNLQHRSTQVLANAGKRIYYYYTYNRLDSIVYPDNPQNNVRYLYGNSTAGNNQRGRIAMMEDASGFQTFFYGKMGEVIENNHTFVLPNETYPYSFKMRYTYDSWNRVQTITYPDGEEVVYEYDKGGMLRKVQGRKNFYRYNYLDSIRYNKFGLKAEQWNGNGTHASYRYDTLLRLDTLLLYNASNVKLQDIKYNYDAVGNILSLQNNAGTVSSLGGKYTCTYGYDSLYRLVQSSGNMRTRTFVSYNLSMSYLADGRISQKTQSGSIMFNGNTQNFSNNYSYTYNTARPHTISIVDAKNCTWDANGNMLSQVRNAFLNNRIYYILSWDEENRLQLADMPNTHYHAYYQYDAGGDRFYKNTGLTTTMTQNGHTVTYCEYDNPVLYASPYVVATPQGYTKHYFVESERIASRIGDGDFPDIDIYATTVLNLYHKKVKVNATAPDSIVPNKFAFLRTLTSNWSSHHTTYWQHGDHLGSASWVTNINGVGCQHLQYLPWGEQWIDQRKIGYSYNPRYTFSGKERDEETGFSYFGARYYNPDLSIWLSVDPMAAKYPSLSPYVYCGNNPVRLVDPDGKEVGNYYDICGNYLGTDGNDDGEVYILTSAHDIDLAESNNSNGFHTAVEEFHSPMRIPFAETRNEIVNGLIERDGENCFAESGCIYGQDTYTGKEVVRWAQMGPTIDPRTGETASVNYNTADRNFFIPYGTAHGHCSGEIGNSSFIQTPSDVDLQNSINNIAKFHQMTSAYFVVALRDCQVHLYDYQGNNATMSIDLFLNLK